MWTAAVGGVNAFAEVWADSSADGGLTWGEDVLIQEQPGGTAPTTQLFSDGTGAAAVFEAKTRGGDEAIYYARMETNGAWSPGKDALVPLTAPTGKASAPAHGGERRHAVPRLCRRTARGALAALEGRRRALGPADRRG